MPLNGRQATELIFLSGLATSAPAGDLNTNKNYPTVTISVAGGQANGITYIMDGGTHNDPFNNLNLPTPFPDALQEFKVETSSLPARYGHHAASAVNLVTKSGTNTFRGQRVRVHPRLPLQRAELLCGRRATASSATSSAARSAVRCSRTSCSSSAAIRAGSRRRNPPTTVSFVPTAAMLAGDFTAIASPACNAAAQSRWRRPAASSTTRSARRAFSPVALNFLEHVPVVDPIRAAGCSTASRTTTPSTRRSASGDYTLSNSPEPVRALPVRGLRQPGDLRRQERADAQPDRPEQPGALAGGRPQLDAVGGDGQLVPRDLQQDHQRSADAVVLLADRPRRQRLQPAAGLHGRERHATASTSAPAAPTPATSTPTASSSPTTSTSCAAAISCRSAATGSAPRSRR